ncbi:hypothetical protein ACBO_07820 [Acinetobacter bouvetii]|nr:hypothetical protein ACBO_07820 [Acinetobacter bouvetii]
MAYKCRIGIAVEAIQIWTVQLRINNVSDLQIFSSLLCQIPKDRQVDFVYFAGVDDTKHGNNLSLARNKLIF